MGDFVRVKAVIGKAALNNEIFRIESGRFFLISFYCKIPFRRSISVSMRHKKIVAASKSAAPPGLIFFRIQI